MWTNKNVENIFDIKNKNYSVNYVSENISKKSIFEYSYLDKKDKYSMFLDNNHPLITITNNNSKNNDPPGKLLFIPQRPRNNGQVQPSPPTGSLPSESL